VLGGGFRFRHRLLQEVAYAALTRARRVELHLGYLRLQAPDELSLRAFHAQSAWELLNVDSPERAAVALIAVRELRLLGEMVFGWQADGSKGIFERAERMVIDVSDDPDGEVPLLLAAHAQTLVELGQFREAVERAARAVELSASPRVEAAARLAHGRALARSGELERSRAELENVLQLSRALEDRALQGRALWALADAWRFTSITTFTELLEAAHEELAAAGDVWAQTQVARLLAYSLSLSGGPRYQHWYSEVLRVQTLDDLRGRAMLARIRSFEASGRGAWSEALAAADDARETGSRGGLLDVVTDGLLVAMQAHTMLGELGAVFEHRDVMLGLRDQLSSRNQQALACACALAFLRAGDRDGCLEQLSSSDSLLEQLGDGERILHHQAVAEVALDAGLWALALAEAEKANLAAEARGLHLVSLQLRLLACRAALASGNTAPDVADCGRLATAAGADSLAELAAVLDPDPVGEDRVEASGGGAPPQSLIEARAIWFENAAMRATDDDEARANWQRARDEWLRLGHTIWPQRAVKASESLPRSVQELAQIPLTPLLDDLTASASDA
jgi:tetratricopeptide (TPR) repeat protein